MYRFVLVTIPGFTLWSRKCDEFSRPSWTVLGTSRPQPAHYDLLPPDRRHLPSWLTAH